MRHYHIKTASGDHGPVSEDQVRELAKGGQLHPTDQVRLEGEQRWRLAREIRGFVPITTRAPVLHDIAEDHESVQITLSTAAIVCITAVIASLVAGVGVCSFMFLSRPPVQRAIVAQSEDSRQPATPGSDTTNPESNQQEQAFGSIDEIRSAAEGGMALAQLELALRYGQGIDVPQDHAEAEKWLRKAADQDLAQAQLNLGRMYATGEGVPKDPFEAVDWFRKAANQGDANAQFYLGTHYDQGRGAPKDSTEAYTWYLRAAAQGHANAQYTIGSIMMPLIMGDEPPQTFYNALTWYRRAAEQGHVDAQLALAAAYDIIDDQNESYKWYRSAAEQGKMEAQHAVGWCYLSGKAVPGDAAEAVKWLAKSAEQGYSPAIWQLAGFYEKGHEMIPQDHAQAARWYLEGALWGDPRAQLFVARAFWHGKGVTVDLVQAYSWAKLAKDAGQWGARSDLELIASEMTPEQISEAHRIASKFKAKIR